MEKRFSGLRFIAGIYSYGSIVAFIGTVLIAAVESSTGQYLGRPAATVNIVLTGLMITIGMAAFGQLIGVLLAIEENTRASSGFLDRLSNRQRPTSSDIPSPTAEQLRGVKPK